LPGNKDCFAVYYLEALFVFPWDGFSRPAVKLRKNVMSLNKVGLSVVAVLVSASASVLVAGLFAPSAFAQKTTPWVESSPEFVENWVVKGKLHGTVECEVLPKEEHHPEEWVLFPNVIVPFSFGTESLYRTTIYAPPEGGQERCVEIPISLQDWFKMETQQVQRWTQAFLETGIFTCKEKIYKDRKVYQPMYILWGEKPERLKSTTVPISEGSRVCFEVPIR